MHTVNTTGNIKETHKEENENVIYTLKYACSGVNIIFVYFFF